MQDSLIIHRHFDGLGGLSFESIQDCDPIAHHCAELRATGKTGSKEMKHAAEIPEIFVTKYINDNNITFREFMVNKQHIRRVLNDPALKAFRVWEGKV